MASAAPQSANAFIEQQLDTLLGELSSELRTPVIALCGPLVDGVDDVLRNAAEDVKSSSGSAGLSLVLTTNGGYIEVVKRMVETLRHHFGELNIVVPNYSFSAGTVFALAGDEIFMDYYSRLGPIDPQVQTAGGNMVPALGYLVKWDRLCEKAAAGTLTLAEIQLMIDGFDQAELYKYEQARELSVSLLKEWLVKYKFKNWSVTESKGTPVTDAMKESRAEEIARLLNDPDRWHTHGHGISMEVLRKDLKLKIEDFGGVPKLSEAIRSYHNLLMDYMAKLGQSGVVHTPGSYIPFSLA